MIIFALMISVFDWDSAMKNKRNRRPRQAKSFYSRLYRCAERISSNHQYYEAKYLESLEKVLNVNSKKGKLGLSALLHIKYNCYEIYY